MNEQRLEVVVLNDHASVNGGSSSVAIASALGLAARGVHVTFFSAVGPIAPVLRSAPNIEVICLEQEEIAKNPNRLQAFASGWRNPRVVHALRDLLAQKSPEHTIVHAHGWTKALSPFALSTAARLGFPLVVTLHDFFLACPNGGFFIHGPNTLCEHRPLSAACWRCRCDRRNYGHKLWRSVRTVIQNHLLGVPHHVAHYIAVSQLSLNQLQPHLPVNARATVVRNPIDAEPCEPANVAQNRGFVFVGRFETEKGVRLFAEAARAAGVPASFVGDGSLAADVRATYPAARFTGWLDREGIRREVRGARALVFPPLWYETLGLVVVEAAAEGVPAIVASRCAATDHVRDGVNGLHFTHGSVEALSRQLAWLACDDSLATRLGRAAHAWYWRQPWTRERHVDDLLRIYREVATAPAFAPQKGELWNERARRIGTGS
jgi:glycosyltransferase involved in cell wall biosynthesis